MPGWLPSVAKKASVAVAIVPNLIAARSESIGEILTKHWRDYGRDFFQREDCFIKDAGRAQTLMRLLGS